MTEQPTDLKERIEERLEGIESDKRLHYDTADVEINAPLALIQTGLKARKGELEWVLKVIEQ